MIAHSYVPQDLRTVDPRQTRSWDDDKARRVTAVRLEIRFGPDSEIARMLGLVEESPRRRPKTRYRDARKVMREFVCPSCGKTRQQPEPGVCRHCKASATKDLKAVMS
jgi:rubrerythrin